MLHKTTKVRGYHLLATDGEIGHVEDFLVDEDWSIPFLVVDTSNFAGGKSVLISTADIEKIDSPAKKVHVRLTTGQIKRSAPVDAADIELVETLPPTII